jgi:chromosome segregation ATPase
MTNEEIIIKMLESISSDVKDVKNRLHDGDRRMDSLERDIQEMKQADEKTDEDVAALKKNLDELKDDLGFAAIISRNVKKIGLYGAALAILAYFFPSFGKFFN